MKQSSSMSYARACGVYGFCGSLPRRCSPEDYVVALGKNFLSMYPLISAVEVRLEEKPWTRTSVMVRRARMRRDQRKKKTKPTRRRQHILHQFSSGDHTSASSLFVPRF